LKHEKHDAKHSLLGFWVRVQPMASETELRVKVTRIYKIVPSVNTRKWLSNFPNNLFWSYFEVICVLCLVFWGFDSPEIVRLFDSWWNVIFCFFMKSTKCLQKWSTTHPKLSESDNMWNIMTKMSIKSKSLNLELKRSENEGSRSMCNARARSKHRILRIGSISFETWKTWCEAFFVGILSPGATYGFGDRIANFSV
jgi:hypothetical protein